MVHDGVLFLVEMCLLQGAWSYVQPHVCVFEGLYIQNEYFVEHCCGVGGQYKFFWSLVQGILNVDAASSRQVLLRLVAMVISA